VRMEQSSFRPDQEFNYKGENFGWCATFRHSRVQYMRGD
jgi:hypothetical protein